MIRVVMRQLARFRKDIDAIDSRIRKAYQSAAKGAGFQLRGIMAQEVKKGAPGGRKFKELSEIAKRTKKGTLKKNQVPLSKTARFIHYNSEKNKNGATVSFGYVDTEKRRLPISYKKLLIKHQEGVDVLYCGSRTELGRRLARIGGRLKKKGDEDAKYFFLRRTTSRKIDLPARPIIDPFIKKHKALAERMIKENFRKKMAGERF